MTNDAIDRAIKRGTGDAGGQSYEAITYEGYAPCGVALMIEVLTDNRNRTGADIRNIFTKSGGSMAEPGAVSWQFARRGVVIVVLSPPGSTIPSRPSTSSTPRTSVTDAPRSVRTR